MCIRDRSHAIEAYTCKIATPVADAMALYAIELMGKNIRAAVYAGDYEAKANMQLGAMLAGIAISQTDVAGVHCMGEALGGMYDTPHGIANASVLPYMMDFCAVSDTAKYARITKALGVDTRDMTERKAAAAAAVAVKELNDDMLIPNLKEAGAKKEDFPELSEKAEKMCIRDSFHGKIFITSLNGRKGTRTKGRRYCVSVRRIGPAPGACPQKGAGI